MRFCSSLLERFLIFHFSVESKGKMTMTQGKHLVVPVNERDHSQGPATATVTLVQYGDYECPYTRQSTTIVRAIQQQLGDQLRFVFRNFPLTGIHPHALHAALAAEAAATQDKFWEMHDYIFHHQHTLEDADLEQFAGAVGLDMQQFARDMGEQRSLARIEEDVEGGERSGVQGTPTFFINGVLYRGSWEHDALLAALQTASRTS
jgi:protein-disulfide isomerase